MRLHIKLVPTGPIDGRESPIEGRYRPQLSIGQRLVDGSPIFWDCEWFFNGAIHPGEEAIVESRLFSLPESILQTDEYLEFFEGGRLVATGVVLSLTSGG